jgi:hypothetical protein
MKTVFVMSVALLCWAMPANAQRTQSDATRLGVPEATVAPDSGSSVGISPGSMRILADTDSSSVELSFSRVRDLPSNNFGRYSLGLTLTAPINKEDQQGFLITRRGLPGDFNAELSFSGIIATNGAASEDFTDDQAGFVEIPVILWDINAAVGVNEFSFRDPLTFTEQEVRRTPYSFSASIGYLGGSRSPFIAAGIERRRSYKAPNQRTLCPPPAPVGTTECTRDEFGPPARNDDTSAFALIRTLNLFGLTGANSPVALEIRAAYDIEDDVFGVEMPVYMVLDDKGRFRAGVRLGWDTDDRRLAVGVFIGAAFDFLQL